MKKKVIRYIWEKSVNIALSLYYGWFAYVHLSDFVTSMRISSLLLVVFEAVIISLVLFRSMPREVSVSFYDWTIAIVGTGLPLLLRPAPVVNDFLALQILQSCGMFISCIGLLSLNKSFGAVAADRGIKTAGLYQHLRHPMYAGYILSIFCFCLQNPTFGNALVFIFFVAFSLLRILAEESFLQKNASYVGYAKKVKWRLLPFVW